MVEISLQWLFSCFVPTHSLISVEYIKFLGSPIEWFTRSASDFLNLIYKTQDELQLSKTRQVTAKGQIS